MCMNCGCGEIDERHGNRDNLIADDMRRAAAASGLDMSATVHNMEDALRKVGGGVGPSTAVGSSSPDPEGFASSDQAADKAASRR